MRVRRPADAIRYLDRLMALDEAAGSQTLRPGTRSIHEESNSDQESGGIRRVPVARTNRHAGVPSRDLAGSSGTFEPY